MSLGTDYIIRYLSDISGAVKGAKQLETINANLAQNVKATYGEAIRSVGQIPTTFREIPIKFEGKDAIKTLRTVGEVVQTTNGNFLQLGKTQTFINDTFIKASTSVKDVTAQYRVGAVETEKATKQFASFAGQSSRLATNLSSVADVNVKLAPQLKNFGTVTDVVGSSLVKSGANFERYEALLKTTDGTQLKLNESISRTPDGIQKVVSTVTPATAAFVKLHTAQTQVAQALNTIAQPLGRLGTNFQNLSTINANFSKELTGMGQVIRVIRPSVNSMAGDMQTTGIFAETSSGKFVNLTEALKKTDSGFRLTKASMRETTKEAANGNNVLANWSNAIWQLASRAILTIPIWMALRGAVMGVFSGISGGFNSFVELDKALNKARVAAGGTVSEIKKEMGTLKPFIEKVAQETGQSIKDLGDVFFSFRASGLDFQTSMGGMEISNKIARTQMGDVKKVAESLAKVMLLMGDSFESGGTSIDKMNTFAALSYELNTKNAFSIDQLTESMLTFAPTAKTAGLSAEQALKIMATVNSAGIMSTSAGRTMSTGLSKFISNFKELTPLLGIKIDPKTGTFNALMLTLDALKKLNAEGTLSPEFTTAIDTLFGGEKGGKTIKALVSIYDLLKQNVAMTGDINKMNAAFNEVNNGVTIQIEKFNALRDAAFRTFVVAVVGGEDFADSIKKFNKGLQDSLDIIQLIGEAIPNARFTPLGAMVGIATDVEKAKKSYADLVSSFNIEIQKGLRGGLSIPELQLTLQKLETKTAKTIIAPGTLEQIKKELQLQLGEKEYNLKNIAISTDKTDKFLQAGSEEEKLAKQKVDAKLKELKLNDVTNVQLEIAKKYYQEEAGIFQSIEEKNQTRLNIALAIKEEAKQLNNIQKEGLIESQLKFLELQGASQVQIIKNRIEYEKMLGIDQTRINLATNQLVLEQAIGEESIKLDNIQKNGFIENALEILRLQGASELQLIQQRIEYEKMYGINQKTENFLTNELTLNKAITKEKYNQNKISSDSMKLFELSQKFGSYTAKETQKVLKGEMGLNQFSLSSKLGQALTEFFPDVLKQLQAQAFFNTGEGRSIGVPETKSLTDFNKNLLPAMPERFKLPDISTQISQINIEIKKLFKQEDTAKQILDSMLEAIRNDPSIESAINEKIDNF